MKRVLCFGFVLIFAVIAIATTVSAATHEHVWETVIECDFPHNTAVKYRSCKECGTKEELSAGKPRDYIGDVNCNGKVTATDYAMLKRTVLNTYNLPEGVRVAADINIDGKIGALDYAMLKRHILQTYNMYAVIDSTIAKMAADDSSDPGVSEHSDNSDAEIELPIIHF